jgi:tetratricopeptide (TPR) repeat protein
MVKNWAAEIEKEEKAIKKDPSNANNHYNYGWALIQSKAEELYKDELDAETKKLVEKAEKSLKKAMEIAPEHGRAHLLLGQLYRYTKRDEEAIEYAKFAMGLPKDTNDWFAAAETVASSYMGLEKASEALDVLEEIRKYYPNNAMILFKLGACYWAVGKLKEAERDLAHLLKVEPGHPQGNYMLPEVRKALEKQKAPTPSTNSGAGASGNRGPAMSPDQMQAKAAVLAQKLQKQVTEITSSGLPPAEQQKRITRVQQDFNDELAALMKQP